MTKQEEITILQGFIEENCKFVFDYVDSDRIPIIKSFLVGALSSAHTLGYIESYNIRLFYDTVDKAAARSIEWRLKNAVSEEVE